VTGAAEAPPAGPVVVRPAPGLWSAAAAWFATHLANAVEARGRCGVALAGGSTPQPLYALLAGWPFPFTWDRIDVFFGDERAVPPDHPDSNYGAAYRSWLQLMPPERVHRMEAERSDRDMAAREYERILPERLDVLLLGIGSDGHTASLFPGNAALRERVRRVVPVTGPKPPPDRLTITPLVIQEARHVAMLVTGANKSAVVRRALEGPWEPDQVPAQLARRGTWFLDAEAGSLLRMRDE